MKNSSIARTLALFLLLGASSLAAAQPPAPAAPVQDQAAPAVTSPAPAETKLSRLEDTTVTLKAPMFSPHFAKTPVALVNEDPIPMEEFTTALTAVHETAGSEKKAGKRDYATVLNRLINARLILQEAGSMGFEETPEIKKATTEFAKSSLKEILKRHQVESAVPDEALVKQVYNEAVKEWQIRSLKFDKESEAQAFAQQLKEGGKFDELATALIDSGKAEGGKEAEYVKPQELLPQVSAALATLKPGEVTPVLAIGPAFTIVKLADIRYPEGVAAARQVAEEVALDRKKAQLLSTYWETLEKKYVKVNKKVLDKIDFEAAKPGFKKLKSDKRVVATIKGDKSITVGDLATAVETKFFHGIEEAIKLKKVNEGKSPTLDEILLDRVFRLEALKQGIDKSQEYKTAQKKYLDSLLFGTFIDKVVVPEIKVTNGEIEDYYQEHLADFSSPEMLKIRGLAFAKKSDAEAAIEQLRKGAEFQWLQANAAGQVPADSPGLLTFSATPLITRNLSEPLQKAVAGAKPGDIRLFASPEGYAYLINIQDVIPAKPSPLATERKTIAQKVFGAKVTRSVDEWADKLRKAYPVKIFLQEAAK